MADPAPGKTALLILAGPAGVGKSTLCDRLVREVPGFERVITATTRPLTDPEENTDRWAVEHGWISLTPLRLDLTDTGWLERIEPKEILF